MGSSKKTPQRGTQRVPRDPTRWSDAGRRSYSASYGDYEDVPLICPRCGVSFTFLASMQKHWFEELKLHPSVRPTVCRACAKLARTERALEQALHAALRSARATPCSIDALVALVRARVLQFEGSVRSHTTPAHTYGNRPAWRQLSWRSGDKNLRAALAECARIRELAPANHEVAAWEERAARGLASLTPDSAS